MSTIALSPEAREALQIIVRSDRTPQRVAKRAIVILALEETQSISGASHLSGMARSGVWKWLSFWRQRQHELLDLSRHKLIRQVASVLSERHPPGHTAKFTPEQVAGILALACTPPVVADTAMPQWTIATLADEAVRRGIVPAISPATVARFLKSGRTQAPQGRSLAEPAQGRAGLPGSRPSPVRPVPTGDGLASAGCARRLCRREVRHAGPGTVASQQAHAAGPT